jgi:hypothetical protein
VGRAVPAERADQRGVHGQLCPSPQRQTAGDHLEPPAVARADAVDVQVPQELVLRHPRARLAADLEQQLRDELPAIPLRFGPRARREKVALVGVALDGELALSLDEARRWVQPATVFAQEIDRRHEQVRDSVIVCLDHARAGSHRLQCLVDRAQEREEFVIHRSTSGNLLLEAVELG